MNDQYLTELEKEIVRYLGEVNQSFGGIKGLSFALGRRVSDVKTAFEHLTVAGIVTRYGHVLSLAVTAKVDESKEKAKALRLAADHLAGVFKNRTAPSIVELTAAAQKLDPRVTPGQAAYAEWCRAMGLQNHWYMETSFSRNAWELATQAGAKHL